MQQSVVRKSVFRRFELLLTMFFGVSFIIFGVLAGGSNLAPMLGVFSILFGMFSILFAAFRDVWRRLDAHGKRIRQLEEQLAYHHEVVSTSPVVDDRIRLR